MRLGCSSKGAAGLREHAFFKGVDWANMGGALGPSPPHQLAAAARVKERLNLGVTARSKATIAPSAEADKVGAAAHVASADAWDQMMEQVAVEHDLLERSERTSIAKQAFNKSVKLNMAAYQTPQRKPFSERLGLTKGDSSKAASSRKSRGSRVSNSRASKRGSSAATDASSTAKKDLVEHRLNNAYTESKGVAFSAESEEVLLEGLDDAAPELSMISKGGASDAMAA